VGAAVAVLRRVSHRCLQQLPSFACDRELVQLGLQLGDALELNVEGGAKTRDFCLALYRRETSATRVTDARRRGRDPMTASDATRPQNLKLVTKR
jgi:hypothetical protein